MTVPTDAFLNGRSVGSVPPSSSLAGWHRRLNKKTWDHAGTWLMVLTPWRASGTFQAFSFIRRAPSGASSRYVRPITYYGNYARY
jgi:hypothetical protein